VAFDAFLAMWRSPAKLGRTERGDSLIP
jgi:hypothetical protein